jgi:hypothetical protein
MRLYVDFTVVGKAKKLGISAERAEQLGTQILNFLRENFPKNSTLDALVAAQFCASISENIQEYTFCLTGIEDALTILKHQQGDENDPVKVIVVNRPQEEIIASQN